MGKDLFGMYFMTFLLIGFISVIVYANTIHNGFHYDDEHDIVKNTFLEKWENVPHFFTSFKFYGDEIINAGHYRPLVYFTYTLNKYEGFYVWVHKAGRINHPKLIARYLGRYVRHPAIANSRLIYFNGKDVGFFYEEHKEGQIIRHDVTLQVDDFISALLQHIPEPQFKMIRYYGTYARRTKKIFKSYLQSSIKQLTLWSFGFRKELRCPYCGGDLEFVRYCKKPPPLEVKSQKELLDWIRVNSKN